MARKHVVFSTHMTRTELVVAVILIGAFWALISPVLGEGERNDRRMHQRSGLDEVTLWTLQRITGALEVYCRDNHAFPYDPRGADQALKRVYAGPSPKPVLSSPARSASTPQEPSWEVRVEYLNPAPDLDRKGGSFILLAARPPANRNGLAFFVTTLGSIYQCKEERVQSLGIRTLAGESIDVLSKLNAASIGDDANVP